MSEMGINEILLYIPHRYPFLLVDRVKSWEPNQSIVAMKNVTVNEPFFTGHFPQKPVMPGVLIIEALAQTAGILTVRTLNLTVKDNSLFYLAGIDGARFKRIVEPGDQLVLSAEVLWVKRDIWKFKAEASVDGLLACSAEIMIARGR